MREIRLSGSEGGETAIKAVFPTPIKRPGGGRLARFVVVAGRKTTCRKVFTPNTQLSLRYFPFPIKTGTPLQVDMTTLYCARTDRKIDYRHIQSVVILRSEGFQFFCGPAKYPLG